MGATAQLSEALQRITLQMTARLDLDEVLSTLAEGMVEELGVASAQVWLASPQGEATEGRGSLRLAAVAGLARTLEPEAGRRALAAFKVGEVAERGEPLLADGVELRALLPAEPTGRETEVPEGDHTFAGCPLVFRGELLGVLSSFSAQPLSDPEAELLDLFARQAAIALGNARLFAEVERLRDRYERESLYLREEAGAHHNCGEIVGRSAPIRRLLAAIDRVAPADTSVLIQGETGTGKELAALAIHQRSRRREGPLVKVNCGAISAGLVESELFGHEKGAFTGAVERRPGRFELADGGTLFLDEVGELPPETQVKLLRALQEGEFERVGGSRSLKVDVRVIAATNRDLAAEVGKGAFRADLYYRLAVFPIEVPPLRQRTEDVPLLAGCFLGRLAAKLGKPLHGFTEGSFEALGGYPWPGNVRELLNVVERAAILSPGPVVDFSTGLDPRPGSTPGATAPGVTGPEPLRPLEDVEREHIERVLEAAGWMIEGRGGAAEVLGLAPSTLRSRMRKLGIRRPDR